ncbi:LPS assembly lipoprotein LptE [Acidihalobacter ferrooxydans]|uniref:LPS-assembly lipoprotein LptE n=1 Tax=Acidihalobacter ferrooxydans TaxID=1765967 RepID=A0A1P8UI56_9GAMM|nr:LPS assembly lipoprotein LptE [Acidihalobacter ferrooxydans]APZ43518.1 hypothetical protein BW247_10815 [Acidihalobacter ferrooxydans]
MSARAASVWSLRLIAACTLTLLLAACGFHLRGPAELPPQMARTYVSGVGPGTTLARALRQALRTSGVQVVDNAQNATAVLRVDAYRASRNVLSLTDTGSVAGYQLLSVLEFSVHAVNGNWHLPKQRLQVQREYSYSDAQLLGKTDEAAQLRKAMKYQLANLAMLRLQARK